MNSIKNIGKATTGLSALALALLSLGVNAGTATVKSSEGDSITYEYSRDAVRMGPEDSGTYSIIRDGKMYAVIVEDGETMVMDASSMLKSFAPMFKDSAPDEFSAELVSMKKTSRKETVAGVEGRVYEVTVKTESGEERTEELVLSTDRRAREFTDALFLMTKSFSEIGGEKAAKQAEEFRDRLDELDSGFLRYGSDMVITSIDSNKVSSERFELPAEPMDMSGIGAMLGGLSAGGDETPAEIGDDEEAESGGAFSSIMGAIGKKIDRQTDRVGTSVDNEVDRETDETVDEGLNKVFGKLFGGR
ncbi:MAG: hypothetical protein AAF098_04675 [Pseudomonadota bacterium]